MTALKHNMQPGAYDCGGNYREISPRMRRFQILPVVERKSCQRISASTVAFDTPNGISNRE